MNTVDMIRTNVEQTDIIVPVCTLHQALIILSALYQFPHSEKDVTQSEPWLGCSYRSVFEVQTFQHEVYVRFS